MNIADGAEVKLDSAAVVYIKNTLSSHKEVLEVKDKAIADLDPEWTTPYIAIVDGEAILRKDWSEFIIIEGQVLVFVDVAAIPQGGGSSNPLQMVLMVAVIALAVYSGGTSLGWGASLAGTFGGTAAGWGMGISMAVMMAGTMLVNMLVPPAAVPTAQTQTASPTYTIQAQGNSARLKAAIPEHFGTMMFYPDLASVPYQEFHGNDQYVFILLCLGRGYYDIHNIYIEDTLISAYQEVTTEVIEPFGTVTLFPTAVATAPEVSGQELLHNVVSGQFVTNNRGTKCSTIGIDFLAPKGLFRANDNGSLSPVGIEVLVEAVLINDSEVEIGSWFPLSPLRTRPVMTCDVGWNLILPLYTGMTGIVEGTETNTLFYSGGTATPQRFSEKFDVSPGRYKVRVTRTTPIVDSIRIAMDLSWIGLRAYLVDEDKQIGDYTLLAVRMLATAQLSGMSARKIRVHATRKLPQWTGTNWTEPQGTPSIAWAYVYAGKQVGLTDANFDLAYLKAKDELWISRNEGCNGRIDNFMSFWDAASQIGSAGRCKPFMQGGVARLFRDEPAALTVAVYTTQNIVKGSFSVDFMMPTEDTADSVEVGYFDSNTWAEASVLCTLPGSTANNVSKVELPLVTSREQAHKYGLYQAASNRYRRMVPKFTTEMSGFIPSFGDQIIVQHDMPGWGQSGQIIAWDQATKTITLSEDFLYGPVNDDTPYIYYIALRRPNGSLWGPCSVTEDAQKTPNKLILESLPDFTIRTSGEGERTHYMFGWGAAWGLKCRVIAVRPKGMYSVEIEAVNEEQNVHTAEDGVVMPVLETSQLSGMVVAPSITGLAVTTSSTDASLMIITWQPSSYADHYVVELSPNGVDSWIRVGNNVTSTDFYVKALYRIDTWVRVCAVGLKQGPWSTPVQYTLNAALMWNPDLSNLTAVVKDRLVEISWDTSNDFSIIGYELRYASSEWIQPEADDNWTDSGLLATNYVGNTFTWVPTQAGISR